MPQYPTPLDSPAISLKKIIINTGEISGGVGGAVSSVNGMAGAVELSGYDATLVKAGDLPFPTRPAGDPVVGTDSVTIAIGKLNDTANSLFTRMAPVEVGIVQRVDETDPAGGTYTCADLKTDNVFYYNSDTVTDAANVTINLPENPRILQTLRIITSIGISNLYLNAPMVIGSVSTLTAASSVSLQCIDEVTKTWVIYCSN